MKKQSTFLSLLPGLGGLLLVSSVLLVAACGTPGAAIDPAAQARAVAARPAPPAAADFPPIESAKWRQGAFLSIEALRQMNVGMGKDQIRNLLGWPHFSEGLAGVREWNYIFHFRTGNGADYVSCQYMVRFNEDMLATGTYWKDPACEARVRPAEKPAPTPAPVAVQPVAPSRAAPPPPPGPQKLTLGADGMFRFGRSGLDDMLPEGRQKVELLAGEIRRNFSSLRSISITGHTDRLGSVAFNDGLSLARANTVRDVLVRGGISPSVIETSGVGDRHPLLRCPGSRKTPELVNCLQPNRRVELEVLGEQ
jgi:outer membrane protein OmpA-like peptidoglycan-associated protein